MSEQRFIKCLVDMLPEQGASFPIKERKAWLTLAHWTFNQMYKNRTTIRIDAEEQDADPIFLERHDLIQTQIAPFKPSISLYEGTAP